MLEGLKPLDASVYMMTLKVPPITAEIEEFRKAWMSMCQHSGTHKTVICMSEAYELEPLDGTTFDFSIALKLLSIGHKITRTEWEGLAYLEYELTIQKWIERGMNGLIYMHWTDGGTEVWDVDAKDLKEVDYKLYKS